jgi:hypothetical protein
MRCVLVNQSQCRVPEEKLGNDQEANILLTIKCLLEDVASVTVGRKVDDPSPISIRDAVQESSS